MLIITLSELIGFICLAVLIFMYVAVHVETWNDLRKSRNEHLKTLFDSIENNGEAIVVAPIRFSGTPDQHSFDLESGSWRLPFTKWNLKETVALRKRVLKELKKRNFTINVKD